MREIAYYKHLLSCYSSFLHKRKIFLVSDNADWALDVVSRYIELHLHKYDNISVARTSYTNFPKVNQSVVHFINRYALLEGGNQTLASSNHIILSWFHGEKKDENPKMQQVFQKLESALERIEKIVVPCSLTEKILLEMGVNEKKIVKIPLGVDLKLFKPVNSSLRDEFRNKLGIKKNEFCIGSFVKDGIGWDEGLQGKMVKGPDILLEVLGKVSKNLNNMVILLTGPARGFVMKGLNKRGIRFVHVNVSSYTKMVDYYHALDAYLITSRSEGGPLALLESWACSVPVVSTKVGMAADLVKTRKTGMLIDDCEDVEALADAVCQLKEDVNLREKIVQAALKEIRSYDWKIIARNYYDSLYETYFNIS